MPAGTRLVWASGVKLWAERRATRRVVHLRPWLFPTVPKGCPYLVDHYLGARGNAPCLSYPQNIDSSSINPPSNLPCSAVAKKTATGSIKQTIPKKSIQDTKNSSPVFPHTSRRSPPIFYVVQDGDSLWKISKKFRVSVTKLKDSNGMQSDTIKTGMVLRIPD